MNTFFWFLFFVFRPIFTQTHGLDHVLVISHIWFWSIGDTIKLSKLSTYNKCINQAVTQRKECDKLGFWASPSGLQHLLEVNISGPDSRFVWKLPLRQESCHLLCRRSQAAADGSDHLPRDQIEHWSEPADDGGNALQSILTIEVITMSSRPMEENRPHVYLKHQTQRCLAVSMIISPS